MHLVIRTLMLLASQKCSKTDQNDKKKKKWKQIDPTWIPFECGGVLSLVNKFNTIFLKKNQHPHFLLQTLHTTYVQLCTVSGKIYHRTNDGIYSIFCLNFRCIYHAERHTRCRLINTLSTHCLEQKSKYIRRIQIYLKYIIWCT